MDDSILTLGQSFDHQDQLNSKLGTFQYVGGTLQQNYVNCVSIITTYWYYLYCMNI